LDIGVLGVFGIV